jgi:hypothetical protein
MRAIFGIILELRKLFRKILFLPYLIIAAYDMLILIATSVFEFERNSSLDGASYFM